LESVSRRKKPASRIIQLLNRLPRGSDRERRLGVLIVIILLIIARESTTWESGLLLSFIRRRIAAMVITSGLKISI
jgi:hypothetical protein